MRNYQTVAVKDENGEKTGKYKPYKFFDLEAIAGELEEMGCQVDAPEISFMAVPDPPQGNPLELKGAALEEYEKKLDAHMNAVRHNEGEMDEIRGAEARHRSRVENGKEIAIELVAFHGGYGTPEVTCGSWSVENIPRSLSRQLFHWDNYGAAKRNVCDWFVGDMSCYSGLTPRAIDELENFGTAFCTKAPRINCPEHAAWEADLAMGTSIDATRTCVDADARVSSNSLRHMLQDQIDSGLNSRTKGYAALAKALKQFAESSNSYYSDRGYAKDVPPDHQRRGYQGGNVSTETRPELLNKTPTASPSP
jgi:hypothetical protein